MKKQFKRIAALLLACCLVLGFAACNDAAPAEDSSKDSAPTSSAAEKVTIVGKWETTVDRKEALLVDMEEEEKERFKDYNFELKITYIFNEDGTYSIKTDGEGMREASVEIANYFIDVMAEAFEMTREEYIAMSGENQEDALKELSDSFMEGVNTEVTGEYKYEKGKLFMIIEGEEFEEGTYTECELTADTLKLTKSYFEGEIDELDDILPLTLAKTK